MTLPTVFASSLLVKRHPDVVVKLKEIFRDRLGWVRGTRDIWCRDYMPVPLAPGRFVQFRYTPSYLRGAPKLRTPDAFRLIGLKAVRRSTLVVDGGNVVRHGDTAVVTDRVYADNHRFGRPALRARLREELEAERLIVIPAEPGDVLGHADGVVRLIDEHTALVNDYRQVLPEYGRRVEALLHRHGIEIVRCPYTPTDCLGPDGIPSAAGVYVNFVVTEDTVVCPTYGLAADDTAIRAIEQCYPRRRVMPVRCEGLAAEGGALNCVTWNAVAEGVGAPASASAEVESNPSMEFIVSDRRSVERGVLVRSAYALISIRDPDKPPVRVPQQSGLRAVLSLAFHDAEPAANLRLPEGIALMSDAQAKEIWNFVRQWQDQVGAFVVHCEQGMSRSPAVAAAICRCMGGYERKFWEEYQPNQHVYTLVVAAGKRGVAE